MFRSNMPFDPKKLRKDAQRLHDARPKTTVGQETTGTTRAIREALPDIHNLRKDGLSWPAIAGALAIQGIVQGKDRIPLTTKRLTAIVRQIEEQERRKAAKAGSRSRTDLPDRSTESHRRLALSSDLTSRPAPPDLIPSSTEEELRRAALKNIQNVLKRE